jgi:hypothetical protein
VQLLPWRKVLSVTNRERKPHPGPFRIPPVDPGVAGIIIATGFVLMGVVALPMAKWFLLSALALGLVVTLLLHYVRK